MIYFFLCIAFLLSASTATADNAYRFDNLMLEKEAKVSCISFGHNGSLWLGLDGMGLARRESKDSKIVYYSRLLGTLPSDIVLCTYRDSKGRQWFGSFGDGPFWFERGKFWKPEIKGLPPEALSYISGISEDAKGDMWLATTMEGLFEIHQDGSWANFNKENSALETNTLTDLLTLNRRILYIATGWGLYQIDTDSGRITPLRDKEGTAFLQGSFVRTLFLSAGGDLWIGTRNGIFIYQTDKATVHHLTTQNGLADNTVIALAQDSLGNMWAVSPKSLSIIDKDYKIKAFNESSIGQQDFHVRAAACAPDGTMYFGTSKGLLMATPAGTEATDDSTLWVVLLLSLLISVLILAYYLHTKRRPTLPTVRKSEDESATAPMTETKIQSADEVFIEKVRKLITDNMGNADYSVEDLSADMGMTRGNLYKRIQAVTGQSPFELMRKLKIARGRLLLEQQSGNISEIAWSVGLSPKQFSKYFKEEYGVLPSEFVKRR